MKHFTTLLFVFLSSLSFAAEESWYTYWAIGGSSNSYDPTLDAVYADAEANPGVSRMELAMDLFGFYFPVGSDRTNLGFVVHSSADSLTDGYNTISIYQYTYSLSAMQFFGKERGDGFYLRADAGAARGVLSIASVYSSESHPSEWGMGGTLGLGYALPVGTDSSIMFSLTGASRVIEDDTTSSFALSIGGLW